MILLKEDGSLKVELVDKLPMEERMVNMGFLTDEQTEYYEIHTSMKPGIGKAIEMVVEYSIEDEIKRGTGVIFTEYLDNGKKN